MDHRLLISICHMYYEKNMSQQQIANSTGLSRMKISRSLQKAKDLGIVKIIIDYSGAFLELEKGLKDKYGLKNAIVVDNQSGEDAKKQVQSAAALCLQDKLFKGATVAVGWGTTLRETCKYMQPLKTKDVLFASIIGGHSISMPHVHSSSIASEMAHKTEGKSISINAPALVQSQMERETFLNDSSISTVIQRTAEADIAFFSLGNPMFTSSSIHKVEYFSKSDLSEMEKNNAVCDLVSIAFLNSDGQECCSSISNRSIGIDKEALFNIPIKICVVEGKEKHASTLAALKAGYIDILVTDKETAEYLANHSS
ncbi:sugar-binding transcriptional regulator [Oceanobacillus sp. FSL W8-0428]|uniref:sugar-binding transcriptional regulator n=1 Tax=Oceanobacillus TaxID=182709 RepID=UPI0030DBADC7